ncbi:galactose-1-phosphate uridylyltransferase [Actinorugispora endophytica]|uniref:galactose-1-phosphate uridylyltransferase n=1 Tax=Actinorugispora endophytica TaxID=1605990 RepID=UPI00105F2A94|nr:galactose-1-phosphate uridylyltransferase [Actinorugispora endophytica]
MRRTATRLADGRELLYFDDSEPYVSGGATRELVDRRDLAPVRRSTRMRRDPLTGDWVAIAAHRMTRTHLPPADLCPLCPSGTGREPGEVPADDYDVAVFENRFPSFSGEPGEADPVDGDPLWPQRAAAGRCEVVCFTAEHSSAFADLGPRRARTVVEAWADRTAELSALPGVEQVFCFENRGEEIGVTLHHPHGQVYAYPFVTPRTEALLRRAAAHRAATGGNLLRDVLDAERAAGSRMVLSGQAWSAYVPAAARWPVEVHLAPHRDVADLAELDDAERDELAHVYLDLLRRMDRFFDGVERLPYIAGWHQAPVRRDRALGRLHLQLFSVLRAPGKLKYLAGSESGMAAWVNDTAPEAVAARLREVAEQGTAG